MKTIYFGLAAATALAAGSPAAAQYANGGYQTQNGYQANNANGNLSARIDQLRVRIQTGVQSGAISRAEAQPLRQQLRALTQLERQYAVNGLSGQERADLQARIRNLRQQIRSADGGPQNGYGDDYGQNQNGRIDRDNDGYDDRDYDRDGRWDDDARSGRNTDDVYGQDDDSYEQPAQRGGLGGIVDRVLGTGGLRVGQRASGNLYGLPSEYRTRYRDSGSAYYRTDGRQIYQIDARTQTVVRVYAMNR